MHLVFLLLFLSRPRCRSYMSELTLQAFCTVLSWFSFRPCLLWSRCFAALRVLRWRDVFSYWCLLRRLSVCLLSLGMLMLILVPQWHQLMGSPLYMICQRRHSRESLGLEWSRVSNVKGRCLIVAQSKADNSLSRFEEEENKAFYYTVTLSLALLWGQWLRVLVQ